jgi:hypothetical protein
MCRNYVILTFVLYGYENQLFILKEECKTQVYRCCNLKILAARRMVWSNFHTKKPLILVTAFHNLVAWMTQHLGFVHLWNKVWVLENQVLRRVLDA